ncbi:MAG: two-component regulator propeller domain-containing protein [Cyclonatronaceae bacterium]
MMWYRLIAVLLFLALFNARMEGQVLPFVHFTPESELNPLPSAESQQVFQDGQGFIWFTVFSSGLVQYDGRRMDLFTVADGLKDLSVWGITQDATGRLWAGSNTGLVVTEKPLPAYDLNESIRFTPRIAGTELTGMAVTRNRITPDSAGNVWVGMPDAIILKFHINADQILTVDTLRLARPEDGIMPSVQSIIIRKNGTVWAGLSSGHLVSIDSDGIVLRWITTGSEVSDPGIEALHEDPEGVLWAGRRNGELFVFNEQSGRPEPVRHRVTPLSGIVDITSSTDGSLWVSTSGSGLIRVNRAEKDQIRHYSRVNGLLSDVVFSVTEDREHNIWIAQSGGVSRLPYNFDAFENFSATSYAGERPVLPSASVGSVAISPDASDPCTVWAGTGGGLACINEQGVSEYVRQEDGISIDWVNGLGYDHLGRLWIGTIGGINSITTSRNVAAPGADTQRDIVLFGANRVISTYPSEGLAAVIRLDMPADASGELTQPSMWFPGRRVVYGFVNETFYALDASAGLPATIMHAVAFDGDGHLWVGTRDRGIYRSTIPVTPAVLDGLAANTSGNGIFEPFWSTDNGAPTNQIETLYRLDDTMWVGTPKGLLALNPSNAETIYHISSTNGFLSDNAASLDLSPATGNLWVGTNMGLTEVDPRNGSVVSTVTRQDGLIDNEVWFYGSVKTAPDGTVYYGTAKGVAVYHPHLDVENTVPPLLKLRNVNLTRTASDRNELVLEYAALSFGNERQVRFMSRLRGYDDAWSDEKTDVSLRYTNLPALFLDKRYTFELMAVNESGVWSEEPLTYTVMISPPWWFQWWAFLVYLIILSAFIFTIDRIQRVRLIKKEREAARLREAELRAETADARSKAAEAQTRMLEIENERKASELEKARELEKAYYELKEAQDQLIQAEKMASLGRMSAGIAHEIKNPLNFINNFAVLSKDLVADLNEAIESNDGEEIEYIISNLKANTAKIEEHGKRADSIVRSMMQHARGGKGSKEPVNLNTLVSENVNLAFHGKKAQINNFNAEVKMDLDKAVGEVSLIPQDVGRVILNIIGNAFDAVWEHYQKNGDGYKPEIVVSTQKIDGSQVEIKVADNGPGIPENIRERIFEPFFTTKPTGSGTGLGLSLSYDIIAQGHGGTLKVENTDPGAAFIIRLPLK